jgi:hypothetical protein
MLNKRKLFIAALVLSSLGAVHAADKKDVVLRVTGKATELNSKDHKSHEFTMQDLDKLKNVTYKATTRYTGTATFSGPLIRDILKAAGVSPDAKELIAKGVDGYSVRVPIADLIKYDVIAASSINGKKLTIESKGPLWIMYPIDQFPSELAGDAFATRMVWNLVGLKAE